MKYVIAGAGSVGYDIAKHLIKEGKDVLLIERETYRAKLIESDLDCMVLNREITSAQTIQEVSLSDGDYFIAVTESDEINLIACAIVNSVTSDARIHVKKIARIRNLEYSHAEVQGLPFLGADYIISPEIEAANQIVETIKQGAISDVLAFDSGDISVRNEIVTPKSIFVNKSLIKIRKEINKPFLITLIRRGDEAIIPSGNTVIREGDNIYIISDAKTLDYVFTKAGKKAMEIKTALVVGDSRIAKNLLRTLAPRQINLKVLIEDYEEAKKISQAYPNVLVLEGDVRDESLFEEERLNDVDLIITVTDNQELNLLSALYAKSIGIDRAVAAVSHDSYISIAQKLGVDATVNPKRSAVDAILKYIRHGRIKTFHSLFGGDAEAIEFLVTGGCLACNKMLKELAMPMDSIIAAVTRNKEVVIPGGDFKIIDGDSVVVVAKTQVIEKVEYLFSEDASLIDF